MLRRKFVQTAAAGIPLILAAGVAPAIARDRSPNSKINIAVAGLRGIGKSHLSSYLRQSADVRVAAICDCDTEPLGEVAKYLDGKGVAAKSYRDIRRLFEDKNVDAVSICLPNYWHALATIWGCQAGKHICVEKPVSHSIWEGRQMVAAARKYKRLVQADIDSRSNPGLGPAIAYAQEHLGRPIYASIVGYKRRHSIGLSRGPGRIPPTCDYDLHSGPLPATPLPRKELHYDWHWQWLSGNGELGNNGPHQLDICRRALGKNTAPARVISLGGRFGYLDDGNVPNTQIVWYDYDGVPVVFESRALGRKPGVNIMDSLTGVTATGKVVSHPTSGTSNCNLCVFFERGYLCGNSIFDNDGAPVKGFPGRSASQRAFVEALKTGKQEDLRCDILDGHISANISHIGNISHQTGEHVGLDAARRKVKSFPYLERVFAGMEKHLATHGISLEKEGLCLGRELTFDSTAERFTGTHGDFANLFLRDTYRPPFTVPENV
ncbi:MAG: Gfo/Idh/MocA family oxidoreductase [Puniceicoccales bacterium]|jgi:predicted dehydrogenase|nr:Gfo/Idh/MocA family oxidoreductase [Puniceicoccales bacterium]